MGEHDLRWNDQEGNVGRWWVRRWARAPTAGSAAAARHETAAPASRSARTGGEQERFEFSGLSYRSHSRAGRLLGGLREPLEAQRMPIPETRPGAPPAAGPIVPAGARPSEGNGRRKCGGGSKGTGLPTARGEGGVLTWAGL